MSTSIFGEKELMPNEQMITDTLRESRSLWDIIKSHVAEVCGEACEEWKYYSKKAGWMLVLKSGKRTICYLIPREAFLKVNFVFGQKAVDAAEAAGLPEEVFVQISEAKAYMEGRSFMIAVKTKADIDIVKKLIEIKWQN